MKLENVEIIKIGEIKKFKGSDFYCVDLVVRTSEEYPQTLLLQCNKEKADNLIKYNKVGDMVDCDINLRGREWTNKDGEGMVFNTLECWKVFKADSKPKVAEAPNAPEEVLPF